MINAPYIWTEADLDHLESKLNCLRGAIKGIEVDQIIACIASHRALLAMFNKVNKCSENLTVHGE